MKSVKILAVASRGGHWVQLMRIRPALSAGSVHYVATDATCAVDVTGAPFSCVRDASAWDRLGTVLMFAQMLGLLLRVRPHVVITTGAAPGLAAVMLGRLFRARTVWIDSIANVEQMSRSGALARRWSTAWVTQWSHLSDPNGAEYWGSVL